MNMCVNCKFATRQFFIFYSILYTVCDFNTDYKYRCFLYNLLALDHVFAHHSLRKIFFVDICENQCNFIPHYVNG